jgi:hypothetical protein
MYLCEIFQYIFWEVQKYTTEGDKEFRNNGKYMMYFWKLRKKKQLSTRKIEPKD